MREQYSVCVFILRAIHGVHDCMNKSAESLCDGLVCSGEELGQPIEETLGLLPAADHQQALQQTQLLVVVTLATWKTYVYC